MLPVLFNDNLFDEFFDNAFRPLYQVDHALYGKNAKAIMRTDIRKAEGGYEMDIDLPGFKKDEVNIELKDGYLTISAAKGLDKDQEDKKGHYIRQERYAGQCSRSFYVGENLQAKDIHAKFEDGILRLSLPEVNQQQLPEHQVVTIE